MQIKIKGLYFLFINILLILGVIFIILPSLDIGIIKHNIEKDIEANVYLYTEIDIKKEWCEK